MSNQENPNKALESEIVEMTDLDQFVQTLTAWHQAQCAKVQHMLKLPLGATFDIEGKRVVLRGKAMDAFKLGVEMALMQLGTLPFLVEMEESPEAKPAQKAANDEPVPNRH